MHLRFIALCLALSASPLLAQDSRPTSRPTSQPTVPTTPVTSRGGLVFTGQDGWKQAHPTSSRMRVVSYFLPGENEEDQAELVVFYFGESGGGIEANIERWYGQMKQPDGTPTAEAAKRSEREINGMKVHIVDVSGTFVAETQPGSGVRVNKEGTRMLAAIFEADSGPHFVKLVGPEATVEKWSESFEAFLEAVQVEH